MRTRIWTAGVLALLGWLGAAGVAAQGTVPGPAAGRKDRGVQHNGPRLNGTSLGEADRALRVVLLAQGVTLRDGTTLSDVTIQGTALRSATRGGADFTAALLYGVTTHDSPVRLRIDGIAVAADPDPGTPANENADVLLYAVSYQNGAFSGPGGRTFTPSGGYTPICPGGERAVAIAGRWDYYSGQIGDGRKLSSDPREITLACQRAAIAKCVERLGYKPWRTVSAGTPPGSVSLDGLHQACVRAVRADYCGDGQSLTREGERINFYDDAGIQKDTEDWSFEAEWAPEGALCVNGTRLLRMPNAPTLPVQGYIGSHCPATSSRGGQPCMARSRGGQVLLHTEFAPIAQPGR